MAAEGPYINARGHEGSHVFITVLSTGGHYSKIVIEQNEIERHYSGNCRITTISFVSVLIIAVGCFFRPWSMGHYEYKKTEIDNSSTTQFTLV